MHYEKPDYGCENINNVISSLEKVANTESETSTVLMPDDAQVFLGYIQTLEEHLARTNLLIELVDAVVWDLEEKSLNYESNELSDYTQRVRELLERYKE